MTNSLHEVKSRPPETVDRAFVIYDRATGRILHRHAERFLRSTELETAPAPVAEEPTRREKPKLAPVRLEELLAILGRDTLLAQATGGDPRNLAMLEVDPSRSLFKAMVDTESSRVVDRPAIELTAAKRELKGDGEDSTEIRVRVLDSTGATVTSFQGPIRVSTSHGRLSSSGGVVKLKRGEATFSLYSTRETIDRVMVKAMCRDRPCSASWLDLAFL